ncbi:UNKNOWN [Stylonychia lemnae]|uniref:Uncharacterized protein n=1 Tax=Stylonychia lemnae TaxID=5949 RepID=A0A078ACL9_STYLE|nr:UNKNOWN [Stylonychia lemnae]|eukprot:CDW80000.1 UNKNOWN [Stylonychia lemnae]
MPNPQKNGTFYLKEVKEAINQQSTTSQAGYQNALLDLSWLWQELIAPFLIYYGPGPVVYPFPSVQMIEAGGIVGPTWKDYGLQNYFGRESIMPRVESLMEELYVNSPYGEDRESMGPIKYSEIYKIYKSKQ